MHPAELGELEAFRDLYAAAPPELGARTAEIGGALCLRLEPLSAVTMFNRALCLGLEAPATDEQLDEALDFLQGVQAYVTVAPEAEPQDLGERLETRGLAPDRGWTKFSRSTDDPPQASTALRVERDERGEAFAEAATRGFEVPDLFLDWLTRLNDRLHILQQLRMGDIVAETVDPTADVLWKQIKRACDLQRFAATITRPGTGTPRSVRTGCRSSCSTARPAASSEART